ncbi:hypothetical protein [Cellulomonas pakistanensis]|uniref:Uncharacterized protein n=1 Tax=Cellulomonas pakistanensis TaxID=992287 RepID=A0A919U1Z1_9CELL|nr:hypothetical protein [Cellulomonas pakistanensis]GIG35453.1 hypothetical protein Cpa01nite_08340 [Cellulomonas pakistanensis]
MTPAARRPVAALALLLAVAAVLALALQPASAARLPVTGASVTTAAAGPCAATGLGAAAGAASGAGTATQVVLSGVPAACRGQVATLRLYAGDGTALAPGDTTVTLAAADSTTVTVPAYAAARVAGVAVTVGTWALPATWAAPAGVPTGPVTPGPGTTFGDLTWTWLSSSGTQMCVTVDVSAASGSAWRVDLHLGQRPFNGLTSGAGFVVSPWWADVRQDRPVDGVVSVGARPGFEVFASRTATVVVCHYGLPAPAYDPALTYAQASGGVTGSGAWACLTTTVRVTGSPQFYAGWRADVDVAPLVAWFAARGLRADLGTLTAQGNYALAAQGGTTYRVTPTAWDTWGVRDDAPRTFQLCVRT